jgi:putative hydrolase of HD superfamily
MIDQHDRLPKLLLELDQLKLVERQTYINGGVRRENSAEHSWQLALMGWMLTEAAGLDLSHEKLMKLALVHDLGEIDGGDTFLYSEKRDDAVNHEAQCIERISTDHAALLPNLQTLWEEQEFGHSKEALFLKVVDRLLPFLHNITSEGKTWRKLGIKKSQVMAKHAFIADDFPELHQWMMQLLDEAEEKGWFTNV